MPTVSVCMVTFNHETFIREAIEGILSQQTEFTIELIIGNDCSTDGTASVVQDILQNHTNSHKIKYFNHPENIGMIQNFAFVLQQCKGKYVALCDGDDYWTDPFKLQKQIDFLEQNPDYSICFHRAKILKKNGEITSDHITNVPKDYETITDLARYGNYLHTPTVVYRNCIWNFPPEFYKSPIGDYFVHMMVAQKGKLKCLNEEMCVYRQGVGFFSQLKDMDHGLNILKFYSCMLSYLEDSELKQIFYGRQLNYLKDYNASSKYKFTTNAYLAKQKSYLDLVKIILKKIFSN